MKENEIENLILEYMMHEEQRVENDLIQLHNNVSLRKCDTLDYVEFIIQNEKRSTVEKVFADLRRLIYNHIEVKNCTKSNKQ